MKSNSTEKVGAPYLQADYWTIGKWFGFLVLVLVSWSGLYLVAHSRYGIPEPAYEYTSFSNAQIRQINRILTTNTIPEAVPNALPKVLGNLVDSATTISGPVDELNMNTSNICDMPCRIDKVLLYINSEFDGKISPDQLLAIRGYLTTFSHQETGVFLADFKIKIRSSFWLAGPLIYLESIFWVIAGVICSLLFSIAAILSTKGAGYFNSKLIMGQVAKMFYAPFIAIIILLTYNYISNNTSLSSNLGQGVIIFAFIVGFFSGRLMNFFNGFKNLLLPTGNTIEEISMANAHMPAAPMNNPPMQEQMQFTTAANSNLHEDIDDEPVNYTSKQKSSEGLVDVDIELKLDNSGLFDDEKNDILKTGFSNAIVTLHNVNGRDIIAAKKARDKDNLFIALNVKPGIYIARATLSMKIPDDHIINLFGERTTYITADKPGFELYIRKYELVD